jgi:hypothetical protein
MLNRGVVWKELRTKRQELRDKGRGASICCAVRPRG